MMRSLRSATGIFWLYAASSIAFVLYSYTQVDLGLTITSVPQAAAIQRAFQSIGYFHRPTSTVLYIGLLVTWFALYIYTVHQTRSDRLKRGDVWNITKVIALILIAAYPAFSLDLFNYMFTAKTVLLYNQNPYLVIPSQFAGIDPWLGFLQWVHLPSAYSPLWILLTVIPYLLGVGVMVLTMLLFKALAAVFYLGSVWLIGAVADQTTPKHAGTAMAVFALSPLVIVEALVSGHNDIVMMFFALLSFFVYLRRQHVLSFFLLSVSVGVKLMTIFLLPAFWRRWDRHIALFGMVAAFVLVQFEREVLPWYFLWVMPFVALVPQQTIVWNIATALSLGLLMRYAPYLYLGHWNDPVPVVKTIVTWVPVVFVGLAAFFVRRRQSS